MNNKIATLDLSPVKARQIVAEIAEDSSRIFFSDHAEEKAAKRRITRTQILKCLRYGHLTENPYRDIYGDWRVTLETVSAGDPITAVAAIKKNKKGEIILIITAY